MLKFTHVSTEVGCLYQYYQIELFPAVLSLFVECLESVFGVFSFASTCIFH